MSKTFTLSCTAPDVQEIEVSSGQATIGRHPDNDVPVEDDLASRFHCAIETDRHGRVVIRDLGSRNGTRVNEQRVSQHELSEGDVIRVGRHVFRVQGLREARASAAKGSARGGAEQSWLQALQSKTDAVAVEGREGDRMVLVDADGRPSGALDATSLGPAGLKALLELAGTTRATDVHLEPKDGRAIVRMRIDGSMVHIVETPPEPVELIGRVVKTACQMKEAGRKAVLDGHFSVMLGGVRVDYRASVTPTVHGQKLVLRVLDPRGAPRSLEALRLPPFVYERVKKVCEQDTGLLLVCGPTGSGKTTTLYNALRTIDRERRNVVTIEDPVEYSLDGVTQIPVTDKTDFNTLLRSVLRQDPDVILVGEIRDQETARTAMQAAMTGHVVFTTVHARDTIGSIFRLIDLGVENYLVANSLDLVIAQRLVRMLCAHCKRTQPVTPGQATRIGRFLDGKTETFAATGCPRCLRTGYHGRQAIFEMLDFANNDALRDLVLSQPSIQKIRKTIEQGVFTTLQQAGWRMAARGETSLDEVEHVTGNG